MPLHSRLFTERAAALARLALGEYRVAVVSARTLAIPVPPPSYVRAHSLLLKKGSAIEPWAIAEKLIQLGYLRVPSVSLPGECALRGEVLDLFMPGDETAIRIHFDFDRIEKIVRFNPATQTGHEEITTVALRPLKEVLWDAETLKTLRTMLDSLQQ